LHGSGGCSKANRRKGEGEKGRRVNRENGRRGEREKGRRGKG
jgi:hypothetical protein